MEETGKVTIVLAAATENRVKVMQRIRIPYLRSKKKEKKKRKKEKKRARRKFYHFVHQINNCDIESVVDIDVASYELE